MDTNKTIATRLKQARMKAGLSLKGLADKLGGEVSTQTIMRMERGETMPRTDLLVKMCRALDVNFNFLFRPVVFDPTDVKFDFRKKSSLTGKELKALQASVMEDVERHLMIDEVLHLKLKEFKPIALEEHRTLSTPEDMNACAMKVREEWGLGYAPISNVPSLLAEHGVNVIMTEGNGNFDGVSAMVNGKPIVVLNTHEEPTTERRRFTALHELGHLLFGEKIDSTLGKTAKENMCNAFANEMLLPTDVAEQLFRNSKNILFGELVYVQEIFGISFDAIIRKLYDMGIVTEGRYKNFWIRKNSDHALKRWVEEERFKEEQMPKFDAKVYSAYAQSLISINRAASLLGVSEETLLNNKEIHKI